jgi:hypothetical protein
MTGQSYGAFFTPILAFTYKNGKNINMHKVEA